VRLRRRKKRDVAVKWRIRKSRVDGEWESWRPGSVPGVHVRAATYDTHTEALADLPRQQRWADRGFR
jgi:hypothetical protein